GLDEGSRRPFQAAIQGAALVASTRRHVPSRNVRRVKVLFLGQISHGQTSLMRMRALERLGHSVRGVHTTAPWNQASWLSRQIQRRLQRGSIVNDINSRVISAGRELRPDLVWAEKQEFLRPETLHGLRTQG